MKLNIDLLAELCATPAVPGAETRIRDLILDRAKGLHDELIEDAMGNVILRRKPTKKGKENPRKLLVLCHMDEIGFLVSHVDKKGFVFVQPIGGFDPRTLFSRRVLVCTDDGDYKGVMNPSGKPLHISSPRDREKVPQISEFFIDLGMGEEAADKISVGDFVVMDEPFLELGDKCVSKALDNRVACWLGLELLSALAKDDVEHECDLYVAFTSQEEVGLRGAKTASFIVEPDFALGVDTTLACDLPGVGEKDHITTHGKGFGLHLKDRSMISDRAMVKQVEEIAKKAKIPYQRTMLPAGGQDGAAAQQTGRGARTVSIVVGTRYIHTVTEMIDKADLDAARRILIEFGKAN